MPISTQNHERFWLEKFYNEMQNFDTKEAYQNLIKNLDEESITTVNKILGRMKKLLESEAEFLEIFDKDEIYAINKQRKDLHFNIIKLNEDCFAYKKYFLPKKDFESCVFYDKHELDKIKNLSKVKNKNIIDAGGFIGDSALILSEYTDKNVYSFEPIKENYQYLLKTIELNKLKNVMPYNLGLGSKSDKIEIFSDEARSSVNINRLETEKKETVKIITLDDFVNENKLDIGLIKVDIEGYEQEFLKGAQNTIKKQKPTLLLSIYHCANDFFFIKSMIESWDLGYKFKIIKPINAQIILETVLIAEVTD